MSDLYGPLTHVTLAFGLWVIPFAPLLAAAYALYAPLARVMQKKPKKKQTGDAVVIANVSVLAASLAFGWTAWETLHLSQLPEGEHALLEHVFRMARFGQLDVALDLAFDPLTSVVALAISGVALALLAIARARAAAPAVFGWASLLLGATLLAVLADGVVVTLIGWEVSAVAVLGMTRDARAFVTARAADAALMIGAAMLFWGLGGLWIDGEYVPDLAPRFAAVSAGPKSDADEAKESKSDEAEEHRRQQAQTSGKGQLTMTSYPGALVFMDDSHTPLANGDAPLRAPFTRFSIPGGLRSFRIHPGSGLDDYLVSHVPFGKDREVGLAVFGATVTYAQMKDQLFVSDAKNEITPRATILGRKLTGGFGYLTVACLLLLVGAAAKSAQAPLHGALLRASSASPLTGALVATTTSLLGAYLFLRVGFLVSLSGPASAVVAVAGGVTAILGGAMASRAMDLRRVLAGLGVCDLGLAMLGAGAGAHAAATLVLSTYAVGAGALWVCAWAVDAQAGSDLRAMGGLKKTMPATARIFRMTAAALWVVSVPKIALLTAVFRTQGTARVPGWALFALGAAAAGLAAYASLRAYLVAFEGRSGAAKAKDPGGAMNVAAWTLGGVATIGGSILAIGGQLVGKSGPSLAGEWLEPLTDASAAPFAPLGAGLQWGLALVVVGVGFAGFSAARRKYGPARGADWAAREPAAETPAAKSEPVPAAANVALGVERWVLDGAYAAVGAASRALALLAGAAEDRVLGAAFDVVADRSARLPPRSRAIGAAACVLVTALLLYWALRYKS